MNPILVKNMSAQGLIPPGRIVKPGTSEGQAALAAAANDPLIGVSDGTLGADDGYSLDVNLLGLAQIEYGGDVAAGDPLTSDASGNAVKAAPASGVSARIIGFAWCSGKSGDIGLVQIAPGFVRG